MTLKVGKSIGNKITVDKVRSGTFSLLQRKEVELEDKKDTKVEQQVVDTGEKQKKVAPKKEKDDTFDVGETLELDLDTDQLNLFDEKD